MQYFEIGMWALLGLITGSFVNVCLDRLPIQFAGEKERSLLLNSTETSAFLKKHIRERTLSLSKPARSFCFSCGHQLSWFENIPVLSFVLSRGRCRKCNASIGARTILTETVHCLVFLGFGWLLNGWNIALVFCVNFTFIWILVNYWKYKQTQKIMFSAGLVLLMLNFVVYYY